MMRLFAAVHARSLTAAAMLTLLGVAAWTGGCESSGSKPPLLPPEKRAAEIPLQSEEFGKLGYRIDWRGFATMMPGSKVNKFDIFGDVVVAQESAGVLTVIETKNGGTRWSDQPASDLTHYLGNVRDLDRLIVSTDTEACYYDIATGTLKAKQKLAIVCSTRPVKIGEILVYGAATGQVLGHLTINGFRQWGAMMRGAIETDPIDVGRGRVALMSQGGDFYVIDGGTGLIQSRAQIFAGTEAPIATSENVAFIASNDHSLYAITLVEGSQLWRERTDAPLRKAPVYHSGRVYCDMGTDGLTAFESAAGKKLWSNKNVSGVVVALRNKRLVVYNGTTAATIDPDKGRIIDTVELKGISMLKPDTFVDGNMYAVSPNGVIAKLAPR